MLAYPLLYTHTCVRVSYCRRVVVSVLISETSDIRPIPSRCFLPRKSKQLEKGPASKTKLDVLPGFRNTVLRTKQVIIGCGGGFHQECTQPYGGCQRSMLPSMMRVNSMETWTKLLPLQGFPAKALLFGVGITNKHQGDCARAMKRELSDAS